MIRRPLIWVLGIWILGEIVASLLGLPLYSQTPLDGFFGEGSQRAKVAGTISNITKTETGAKVSLSSCVAIIDEESYETNGVLVFVDEANGLVGDKVVVSGTLKSIDKPDNYGEFDSWSYYRTRDIDYMFYADSIEVVEATVGIKKILYSFKMRLYEMIDYIADDEEEAAIYKALVFGDKTALPDETYDTFKVCGMAHLLAVGGMHLSIMGGALLKLLKKVKVPILFSSIIADALLLLFVIMIDGSASAWRAYIMFTLSLIAPLIHRTYDLLSALGVAGILLLITNPLYALDSAFQLSFSAMFAIGVIFPKVKDLLESIRPKDERGRKKDAGDIYYKIAVPFAFSLSIQVMMFPVVARNYYTFSPYGVVLNLAVIPFMAVTLMLVIASALVGALLAVFLSISSAVGIGSFIAGGAHYFFEFLMMICDKVKDFPYAQIMVGRPSNTQVALYYLFVALILFIISPLSNSLVRFKKKKFAVVLLFAAFIFLLPIREEGISLNALYVGQGDSTVVNENNGHAIIFDAGSSSKKNIAKTALLPYLKASAITDIDMIVISHPDIDHYNGVIGIIEDELIRVHGVAIAESSSLDSKWDEIYEACDAGGVPIYLLSEGDEINVGEINLKTISPVSSSVGATSKKTTNESSLVVRLEYQAFSALFTGDITSEEEKQIIKSGNLEEVSYLKSPHHGSKYSSSSEFLGAIKPAITTFSAGRGNSYGHPTEDAIDRTSAVGSKVYKTDTMGMVTTRVTENQEVSVTTFK